MKKKNLKVPFYQFNGQELKVNKVVDGVIVKDAEGRPVMETVLVSDQIGQVLWEKSTSTASPDEKYKAFKIAQRIAANPEEVELSDDDLELIKAIVATVFHPGYFGQVVDLLESDK